MKGSARKRERDKKTPSPLMGEGKGGGENYA
jgi:hypothetical protein